MASTGIIQRRYEKNYFLLDINKPLPGEIVYALDTNEYGALNKNGSIDWVPHIGLVESVAGKIGKVVLDKLDVGLGNVDDTADLDKPISNQTKNYIDEHKSNTNNPHNITKAQVGLSDVDNTADLDKPISGMQRAEFDRLDAKKCDNSRVLTDVPANAKFTDTTYTIKDGELSEFNFNAQRKDKLDNIESASYVLGTRALTVKGRVITLTKGDGSIEQIETQDGSYNDTHILKEIANLKSTKVDNSRVLTDVPANAKFTDTIYDDTDIKQNLQNVSNEVNTKVEQAKEAINTRINTLNDNLINDYLRKTDKAADSALLNGKKVSSDLTNRDENTPASIKALSELNDLLNNKLSNTDIKNDLTGGADKVLSAEQGKKLNEAIEAIKTTLKTDDTDLDTLQEIINFIKKNKGNLGAAGIDGVIGLREALERKLDKADYIGSIILEKLKEYDGSDSGLDADLLDGKQGSEYNQTIGLDTQVQGKKYISNIKLEQGVVKEFETAEITPASIGLGNVDNTSDANKPVSTAQKAALDLKADAVPGTHGTVAKKALDSESLGGTDQSEFARTRNMDNIKDYLEAKPGVYTALNTIANIPNRSPNELISFVKFNNSFTVFFVEDDVIIKKNNDYESINSDIPPTEILEAIKTVDGRGSGLDADLFQGKDIAYFATKAELDSKTGSSNNLGEIY